MALTQKKLQSLKGKQLDRLYGQHIDHWTEKARSAYGYVSGNLPAGEQTRIDDVAEVLVPILAVDPLLTDVLQSKNLPQKYWVSYFCDYALERFWETLRSQRTRRQT